MIANYGYTDGEGAFYITIDTGKCESCVDKPCIGACPADLFVPEQSPYGDEVVAIDDVKRKMLRYECMVCKPSHCSPELPCMVACPYDAITHSW